MHKQTRWHKVRTVNSILRQVKELFGVDLECYKEIWISDPNFMYSIDNNTGYDTYENFHTVPTIMRYKAEIKTNGLKTIVLDSFRKGICRFV